MLLTAGTNSGSLQLTIAIQDELQELDVGEIGS
jgi:hypothetical protein